MNDQRINISVKTAYIEAESEPENNRFVFAYTITLKNTGEHTAQLVSRHWHITDENDACQEVRGMGVVGVQPRLQPGEEYTYTSGVVLKTATGMMEGSYQMLTENKELFEAPIPAFALVPPFALH